MIISSNIHAIIFDFDGVILHSEPLHYEACCTALSPLGIDLDYEEFADGYLGLADKDMFPKLLADKNYSIATHDLTCLIKQKQNYYVDLINRKTYLPLIDFFEQFLFKASQNIDKIAICTGAAFSEIQAVLNKVRQGKLCRYFSVIVTSEHVAQGKPSPEGYLLAAQRLEVSPKHCLVIEDTHHGLKAAQRAGMQTIGLMTTYTRNELLIADRIAHGYIELL
ncbi:MAG: beta-phosphoglucomutase [Legionella sp. 40-6]|nr:HAD family phosphatase [Legionella sp.]OJY19745.1 MAG: beta-phosphoglucomutase [Legionella sp. 40-6]